MHELRNIFIKLTSPIEVHTFIYEVKPLLSPISCNKFYLWQYMQRDLFKFIKVFGLFLIFLLNTAFIEIVSEFRS